MRPTIKFLSEDLIEQIISEAKHILCSMGFELQNKPVLELLAEYDHKSGRYASEPNVTDSQPGSLSEAMHIMRRIVEGVGWAGWCNARANLIEPMLGYCLRKLEMELQPGSGVGHGLVGVFEIRK